MSTITTVDPIIDLGADPLPAPLEYRIRWSGVDLVVDVIYPRRRFGARRYLGARCLSTSRVDDPCPRLHETQADRADRAVLDACRRAWAQVHLDAESLVALDDPARFTGRTLQ